MIDKFLLVVTLIISVAIGKSEAQAYLPNAVIFKVSEYPTGTGSLKYKLEQEIDGISVEKIRQVFPEPAPIGSQNNLGERRQKNSLGLIYEINYNGEFSPEDLVSKMSGIGWISYAQPHYLPVVAAVPNDEFLDRSRQQYEMIQLFEGWDIAKGDSSIVIGLVDTGTDTDHPDLLNNFSFNYKDSIDGLDNDADGYTDNFLGWDVAENDNDAQSVKSHHGVHISGVVGATPNNTIGVAGVGYSCRFLPVKIAEDSMGTLIAAYEGLKYAADAGCQIINCSWGGYFVGQFERDVMDYVIHTKNCLVIAAAGNDNKNELFYPAAFKDVMAVASVDSADKKLFNSNFHRDIDISAPGLQLYSTWNGGLYQSLSGSSVATAIVSGVAGILKSRFPDMTNGQIIERIKNTSEFIYDKNETYFNQMGRGRVNLYRALIGDDTPVFQPALLNIYPNPVSRQAEGILTIYMYLPEMATIEMELISIGGKEVGTLLPFQEKQGIFQYKVNVSDYPSGIYLLRYKKDGQYVHKKLIIQ